MFVSHARVRIVGLGGNKNKKRRFQRRRLAFREVLQMPCLLPTIIVVFLGLLAVAGGVGMAILGYMPSPDIHQPISPDLHQGNSVPRSSTSIHSVENGSSTESDIPTGFEFYMLKSCSYLGPLLMAVGLFAMIVSGVFYCEILDKYAILVPDKRGAIYSKEELYEIIIGEMKKSYAQSLVTAYTKAAERTMIISDNKSVSGDFVPEPVTPCKPIEPLSLEQQIDIECEGYTPSPPIPNKRYSVIQARIQRLRSEDNWLKTSSLPNIRRSEHASIKRVNRLRNAQKHSLSCDYTMDEARLRRKSMMLRSIIMGHSSSSGDLPQRRGSRRFSSVKCLPGENTMSLEEMSQGLTGSFPLTRMIQRRGTFACGDMRTRRMKFLLLLQASESKEKLSDTASMDGRVSTSAIRRNSFIPYTTCDRFIAGEERKHFRERRTSVNPFTSAGNRFGNPPPPPGLRRHSFFPIRREDKIYVGNPNEQRRHSFNPAAINNMTRPEYAAKPESRRGSFNPDISYDSGGIRRESYIPPQKSNFLQVPGFHADPMLSERRPSASDDSSDVLNTLQNRSDAQFSGVHNFHDNRMVERRHSYQPITQTTVYPSEHSKDTSGINVPQIVISTDSSINSNRFLSIPQEYHPDDTRHSFNAPTSSTTKPPPTAFPPSLISSPPRHVGQRISFNLKSENVHPQSPPPTSQMPYYNTPIASNIPAKSLSYPKPTKLQTSPESPRPSSFKQEMVVFSPLTVADSRSISPISNISCCGSERIGSERSARTGRTASLSSERTTRTLTPVSVAAQDSINRDESLERPPTPIDIHPYEEAGVKSKPEVTLLPCMPSSFTPPSSLPHISIPIDEPGSPSLIAPERDRDRYSDRTHDHEWDAVIRDRRFQPVPLSGHRYASNRPKRSQITDSPASTSSGPATLLPSSTTDANASLYRSRSASAISSSMSTDNTNVISGNVDTGNVGFGISSDADPSSFISYATLSPAASTARPSVKDKTVRAKQKHDDKS